jgi:predicted kinase
MVRAKVAWFRLRQLESPDERTRVHAEYRALVDLARHHTQPPQPTVTITHGLAGSGKTTCARRLLERTGAIRIRTDIERKRLHGLEAAAPGGSDVGEGLYTADATRQTYKHVCTLARMVVQAGYRAVVDGAFLQRWQRAMFRETATSLGVPFVIVDVSATDATLRERITRRRHGGADASDATLAVLDAQLRADEPLDIEEQRFVVSCDTAGAS